MLFFLGAFKEQMKNAPGSLNIGTQNCIKQLRRGFDIRPLYTHFISDTNGFYKTQSLQKSNSRWDFLLVGKKHL